MTTYLYRAVNAEPIGSYDVETDEIETIPAGEATFGRMSGYLSRSGAASAGMAAGVPFEIVRSEPVIFLTKRERIQRDINRLHAELAEIAEFGAAISDI